MLAYSMYPHYLSVPSGKELSNSLTDHWMVVHNAAVTRIKRLVPPLWSMYPAVQNLRQSSSRYHQRPSCRQWAGGTLTPPALTSS